VTEADAIELQPVTRLAKWSVALGTLGLLTTVFGIGVILALIGIGCAAVVLNQSSETRAPDAHHIALVGLLASVLALLVFPLLFATAVPRFIATKQAAAHERCYSNLLTIDAAKEQWARRHHVPRGERIAANAFDESRLPKHFLHCPSGGHYAIGGIGRRPRCSITAHNESLGTATPPRQLRFSAR
jgi:hypothetical protein